MSFYGNIKNTARTQFYFDRIYPNRMSMDTNAGKDNIFAGRYVLVEYEQDISADDFAHYYYYGGNMYTQMAKVTVKMALDPTQEIEAYEGGIADSCVRPNSISNGTVCCIPIGQHIYLRMANDMYIQFTDSRGGYKSVNKADYDLFYKQHLDMKDPEVYIINDRLYTVSSFIGGQYAVIKSHRNYETSAALQYWRAVLTEIPDSEDPLGPPEVVLTWQTVSEGESVFQRNFNVDKDSYSEAGRTYDSTVWQKVYVGNVEKYIMIADLNTITPTFNFTADAPTVTPVPIHYDPNNTNTNYNIHMQGPWGFRIKGASGELKVPTIDKSGRIDKKLPTIDASKDNTTYPSDFNTKWKGSFYDVIKESENEKFYSPYSYKWNGIEQNQSSYIPGAVYINRGGFSPKEISKSKDVITPDSPTYDPKVNVDIEDRISISPTGYSGRVYNDHLHNEGYEPQPDTQELSLMLPSIGDAISDMWDMIYGGRDTDITIKKNNVRNLDYNWEYANGIVKRQGLRSKTDGLNHFNGPAVDTLAGCINSVHDLMGMIIVENSDALDLNEYEDTYVYQFADGTYRRKTTLYTYERELAYTYVKIELSEVTYSKGHFYTLSGSQYVVCNDETFTSGKEYYYKKITIPEKYKRVDNLVNRPDFTLYYRTPLDPKTGKYNYKVVHDIAEDIDYYKWVSQTPIKVTAIYEPYAFYYAQGNTGFILDTEEKATEGRGYFNLVKDSVVKPVNQSLEDVSRYDGLEDDYILSYGEAGLPESRGPLKYIYCPDRFYKMTSVIKDGKEAKTIELETRPYAQVKSEIDMIGKTDSDGVKHLGYHIMRGEPKKGDNQGYWVQNKDGSFTTSDETTNLVVSGMYKVDLLPWKEYTYCVASSKELIPSFTDGLEYDEDGEEIVDNETNDELEDNPLLPTFVKSYTYVTEESLKAIYEKEFTYDTTAVFTKIYVPQFQDAGIFYSPNTFYYQTPDGSYAVDTNDTMTENRSYYADVSFTIWTGKKFYIPNKYYIIDPIINDYVLDKTLTFDTTKTYYKFNGGVYVMSDSLGLFAPHSEWNDNVTQVPASVRLCLRDEQIGTEIMPSFARGLNTIHGLILKLNQILEIDNFNTRERTTLQGCMNVINDIINKFNVLRPNNFAIVDDYGRVNNAHWDNLQKVSSAKVKSSNEEIVLAEGVGQDQYKEVNSVANMRGQWLTLCMDSSPANPSFTIHHNFQSVTDTTSESNKNTDNVASAKDSDKITLYTPIVDAMGHVVGKNTETMTLPYGFKTIASNGSSAAVTELTVSNANIIAENTQDTFTFNIGNKWIRTATNAANDTMTIAHAISPIANQANTKYGLEQDETINVLDADNEFEVPVFKFDEAGHIIFAETHKVKIPEVFTDVNINGSSTDTSDTSSTDGTISADSLTDTLNFAAGNKWIQMSHDDIADTVTFKHYVKKFTESTAITDLDNSATFTVQELAWDNAGHLTGSTKRTYTIQDGYKYVAIANSGSNITTQPTGVANTLEAQSRIDTLTIDTSNRWLTLVADTAGRKVTLGHAAPGTASNTKGQSAATSPNFGETFKVTRTGIDQTGHVKDLNEYVITLPTPSLTNGTGNVVTGLSLVASTGAFTETKANVGTLTLTGYTGPSARIAGSVAASDTINSAFSKVQSYLGSLTDRIDELEERLKALEPTV